MSERRSNGEGTIYKSGNYYVYQFYVKIDGDSIRKKAYGKTKKEAKEKASALKQKLLEEAEKAKSKTLTVGDYLDHWLSEYVSKHVGITTEERYALAVNNHIKPYVGNEDLKTLSAMQVQALINKLHESGGLNGKPLSARTVNTARTVLGTALKQAVCDGLIEKNPVPYTKRIKISRAEINVLTVEECNKLVAAAKEDPNKAVWIAIVIALETGMRKGEVFGLKWSDIDFENKTITINRTVITGNNGMIIQNATKTKYSRRTIDFTDSLLTKLLEYREWQHTLLEAINATETYGDFIITSMTGTVKDPNSFTTVNYKRIIESAGLNSNIRYHDLRHTHATLLISAGVDIKTVSSRLGHASIKITLDTYAHVMPAMTKTLLEKLDGLQLT